MKTYRAPYYTVPPHYSEIFKPEATFRLALNYIYSGITDGPWEHLPHKIISSDIITWRTFLDNTFHQNIVSIYINVFVVGNYSKILSLF